jgi:hypothetical protein
MHRSAIGTRRAVFFCVGAVYPWTLDWLVAGSGNVALRRVSKTGSQRAIGEFEVRRETI